MRTNPSASADIFAIISFAIRQMFIDFFVQKHRCCLSTSHLLSMCVCMCVCAMRAASTLFISFKLLNGEKENYVNYFATVHLDAARVNRKCHSNAVVMSAHSANRFQFHTNNTYVFYEFCYICHSYIMHERLDQFVKLLPCISHTNCTWTVYTCSVPWQRIQTHSNIHKHIHIRRDSTLNRRQYRYKWSEMCRKSKMRLDNDVTGWIVNDIIFK